MEFCSSCKKFLVPGTENCPEDGARVHLAQEPPSGTILGGYRLKKKLGAGAMGWVFLAEHLVLQKQYALKLLRPKFIEKPEIAARFIQEARAANAIKHPHVVTIYDFGRSPNQSAYLVMEYLEGENLSQYLKKHHPIPLKNLLTIFIQISSALFAVHEANIIHRDLKPDNIFLKRAKTQQTDFASQNTEEIFVKVLDFGVAKLMGELALPGLSRAGTITGTPQYMAPEQLMDQGISTASDIYSLGIIFYKTLSKKSPFSGPKLSDFARQHLFETPKPFSEICPEQNIPEKLEALIQRMLAKKPKDRPSSMKEVETVLQELQTGKKAKNLYLSTQKFSPKRKRSLFSRKRYIAILVPILLLLSGVCVYWIVTRNSLNIPTFASKQPAGFSAILQQAEQGNLHPLLTVVKQEVEIARSSSNITLRKHAIAAIETTRDFDDLSPLLATLRDPNPEIRRIGAKALGSSQKEEAIVPLREAFEKARGLQFELALARINVGDKSALRFLVSELQNKQHRWDAALVLVPFGEKRAIAILEQEGLENKDINPNRAIEAASVLAKQGDKVAKQTLRTLLVRKEPDSFLLAANALAMLGEQEGREVLQRVGQDSSHPKQQDAAILLASLQDPSIRKVLQYTLVSSEKTKKQQAALALASFRETKDILQLAPLLKEKDPFLRSSVAQAIWALRPDTDKGIQ